MKNRLHFEVYSDKLIIERWNTQVLCGFWSSLRSLSLEFCLQIHTKAELFQKKIGGVFWNSLVGIFVITNWFWGHRKFGSFVMSEIRGFFDKGFLSEHLRKFLVLFQRSTELSQYKIAQIKFFFIIPMLKTMWWWTKWLYWPDGITAQEMKFY